MTHRSAGAPERWRPAGWLGGVLAAEALSKNHDSSASWLWMNRKAVRFSMKSLLISLLLSLATPAVFAWSGCGVVIDLPSGWNAVVVTQDKTMCEIGARPANWQELEAKSRWSEDSYALHLKVFRTSFKAAGEKLGFERDEHGRWGVPGFRSMISDAKPATIGAFSGWRSEPMSRGFARDGADLRGQSRIYSAIWVVLLLRDRHRMVIGVEYNRWSPDIHVDRDAAAESIVRSLRRAR